MDAFIVLLYYCITWTACTGCSNLNLKYIAYNGSLYLAQGIFVYLLKSTNGIAWSTVSTIYNTSGSGPSISQLCITHTNTWLVLCGNSGLYKSTDGGSTWVLLLSYADFAGGACTYNSTLNL